MSNAKNNYALLNSGDENSFFYSSENKSGLQKTRRISVILNQNFRQLRRNNSAVEKSHAKHDLKNKKQKFILFRTKHSSVLNEIKKITPKINLDYQIELYEQKSRYSLVKKDEVIDEKKFSGKNFLKKNYKDSYSYKTCLDLRGKKKYYILKNKSICHGKFRSLSGKTKNNSAILFDKNISININKYTDNTNNIFEIRNKFKNSLRPKSSTKNSTFMTNVSRQFSAKIINSKTKNNKNDKIYQQFKKKFSRLKSEVDKVFDKAANISMELNRDIYGSKNYDKLNKLEEESKKSKKNKSFHLNSYNKKKSKDSNKDDLYKYLDIEKNVENKIIKSYKYFDKTGKNILKQAMEQDKQQQNFLNKNENSKNIILNSRFFIKKLQNELGVLGANILATKKKYKGQNAIEPKNEMEFLHKLIKENTLNNLNDEQYYEGIKRRNAADSLSNRIKKRLLSLQQKSLSIKNKIRDNDYNYL